MESAMKSKPCHTTAVFVLLALASFLSGCSSVPEREAMTPEHVVVSENHPYSVTVKASANKISSNEIYIQNEDLQAAIEEGLTRNNLFKSVVHGSGADYELHVRVLYISQTALGPLPADIEATWDLVRLADHARPLHKTIRSTGRGSAFGGQARAREAVEAAIRENIILGLQSIAALNL